MKQAKTATASGGKGRPTFLRRAVTWVGGLVGGLLFFLAAVIGFGTSSDDFTSLSHFTRSVKNWQANTEFRQVAMQYVTRGSDAMRSRPMGFTAADWIVFIRSLPVIPKGFELNDTSRAHYANFSKGPLSAYLHLCSEVELFGKKPDGKPDMQGGYLPEFEALFGKSAGGWSRDELYGYLAKQHWDYPVVKDAGAVESLRAMLIDVQISKPLTVRQMHVDDLLRPHIRALAAQLDLPTDPEAMTPQEQYAVFDRLDAYVKRVDPELWRTKQVSDFVGGIWGQVFSPPYTLLLGPYVQIVPICQWLVLGTLAVAVVALGRRVTRHEAAAAAALATGPAAGTLAATTSPEAAAKALAPESPPPGEADGRRPVG